MSSTLPSPQITFDFINREVTPPFVVGSPTSYAAALQIKPQRENLKERVYRFIVVNPGSTDEQIAEGTGLNPSTARPRRVDLEKEGRIYNSGHATTMSGRWAKTWRAK